MAKQQLSITIDDDVFRHARSNYTNVSDYFNDLGKEDLNLKSSVATLTKKISIKTDEIEILNKELDLLQNRLNDTLKLQRQEADFRFKENYKNIVEKSKEEEKKYLIISKRLKQDKEIFEQLQQLKKSECSIETINVTLIEIRSSFMMQGERISIRNLLRFYDELKI